MKSHIESEQISQIIVGKLKRHLHAKQVENKVDLYHDSDRDKESYMESKQIS